jgi:hypothetical protein
VNPVEEKRDAALVLRSTSLYQSVVKKLQQLHGDFGVAAAKSGLAGYFIGIHRLIVLDSKWLFRSLFYFKSYSCWIK